MNRNKSISSLLTKALKGVKIVSSMYTVGDDKIERCRLFDLKCWFGTIQSCQALSAKFSKARIKYDREYKVVTVLVYN